MIPDQLLAAIIQDPRLPAEGRVIIIEVALRGEGGHTISFGDFCRLLPGSSERAVRRGLRDAEETKWLKRVHGGRGHSDKWIFSPNTTATLSDSPPTNENLSDLASHKGEKLNDRVGTNERLSDLAYAKSGGLSPPSTTTPPPPSPIARANVSQNEDNSLHPDAARAIDGADGVLAGCRGSLRDYLVDRVEHERQYAYVQRVVTSLQGADEWMWQDRRGKKLDPGSDRTEILAAAFNELASGDEVSNHFPEAPGGFGNLRSKVRYLVASRLGVERDSETKAAGNPQMRKAEEDAREARRRSEATARQGPPATSQGQIEERRIQERNKALLDRYKAFSGDERAEIDEEVQKRMGTACTGGVRPTDGMRQAFLLQVLSEHQQDHQTQEAS